MPRFLLFCWLACCLPLTTRAQSSPETQLPDTFVQAIRTRLDALVQDDLLRTTQLGLYVYDLTTNRPLYQLGHQQRLRPASTQKLLTGIIALDLLGSDYRFTTSLYLTGTPADSVLRGNIIVKGGFDPMLGRDDLRALLAQLKRSGVWRVEGDVLLDLSMKDTTRLGWGWCWDDDEPPLTPLSYQRKGNFRTALLQALEREGIVCAGEVRQGLLPADAIHVASRWHGLDQVLIPMMKRSDNFYAESVFYNIAAARSSRSVSYKDGKRLYEQWVATRGVPNEHFQAADGSGLSLYNYLTPQVLVDALRYAAAREEILNHLLPTLPIMGRDGTLRRRCRGTSAQGNVQAKTGTVDGVSSLAGYALAPNGHRLAFAIINQGLHSTSKGRRWQDRVCMALTEGLGGHHIEPDTIASPAHEEQELEQDDIAL